MFDMFKQYFPPNIDKLEKNKDVESLAKILTTHKDRITREKATYALGRINSDPQRNRAIEILSEILKDQFEDEGIRSTCALALAHNTVPEVERLLISQLKDDSEGIRSSIVQALADFKTPESMLTLIESLNDLSPKVRAFAGEYLGLTAPLVQNLKDILFNDNETVRAKAIKEMGSTESRKAMDILIMLTESSSDTLRRRAIQALGGYDSPAIIEPLMARVDKEFGENLVAIYASMGKAKSEKTIDFLIDGLKKDSPAIKAACVQALCEKRSDKAIEKLLTILVNPQEFQEQRIIVAKALAKTKRLDVLDAMVSLLGTSAEQLRSKLEDSIVELDLPNTQTYLKKLIASDNEVERFSAAKIIIKQKKTGTGYMLRSLVNDQHEEVKNLVIMGLGDFKEPGVSEALIAILSDFEEPSNIRGNAARSLGRLAEEKAMPPLFDALRDEDEYVRGSAAMALGNYKKTEVIDALGNTLFTDPSEMVKCMILESLGQIKDVRVLDYLKRAESDFSENVKNTAVRILRSIGK